MTSRSRAAFRLVVCAALGAPALFACNDETDPKKKALSSAGGLSESEWPKGARGDTPAPTAANSSDESLEKGWYKHAAPGDKAPRYNDRPSGFP